MYCIICLEYCNNKPCNCNKYIHQKCLKEWNDSIYNINQKTCPYCKNIIKKDKINIILNSCNKYCNIIYNRIIKFYKCIKYYLIKIFNIVIIIIIVYFIPLLIGISIFSLNFYLSIKENNRIKFKNYIINNLFIMWLLGFIITIMCIKYYNKCKNILLFNDDDII